MNYDEYGEVINGFDTYNTIAEVLNDVGRILVGWTDGKGTHYDLLFTYGAIKYGTIQGGLKQNDLFVSIMRCGAFGFGIMHSDSHPSYVSEKLFVHNLTTATPLAELINEVRKLL